jgi:cellulose biosynthesis protein BcsQ
MTMARSRALLKTRNQPDLLRSVDGRLRLKQHLQSILDQFDFIIIDTPPTLGIFTQARWLQARKS